MNNKPWKNESFHISYEEANKKRQKLLSLWEDNSMHEGMQVKVKFLSSRNRFVVKTRLHPDFEKKPVKNKKNAKSNKKNKRLDAARKSKSKTNS
jgi:hypothetical protein